ncbi:MAG: T9SS type A sorting domain-containing protein, partial [Sphingobacteriales bacterium]
QEVYYEAASTNNTAMEHQLKLQNVPDGMYMLQVEQDGKVLTKRVIKQK